MPHSNFLHRARPRRPAAPAPARAVALALAVALAVAPAPAMAAAPADAAPRWAALTYTAFKQHANVDTASAVSFAQDRAGFVWIGTQAGLVRWDGHRTRRFTAEPMRADALPDGYITSLLVDRADRLWAGTSSGGLARYDAAREAFTRYPAGPGGLSGAHVTALADDGAGGLWVGTGAGLDRIDAGGAVVGRGDAAGPLPAGGVRALLRDAGGRLWIGTAEGLFARAPGARAPAPVALAGAAGGDAVAVTALHQDGAGRIWIGTRAHGAFVAAAGALAAEQVPEAGPGPALRRERVTAIAEAGDGQIWLGTDGSDGGIAVVDPARGVVRRIRHQADTPDSLNENDILALFRERSGMLFVGTMGALLQHDPLPRAATTVRDAGAGARLSVPSLLAHGDGRLWLGVVGGGVDLVDPRRGTVARLRPDPAGAPGALPPGRVLAMAAAADGAVWLGTERGLYRAGADGAGVRRVAVPGRRADAAVWALAVAGPTLWFGGLDGLWALAGAAGARPAVLRREQAALGDARVTALLADGAALWVGTRSGLARVGADGAVELVPTALDVADRLTPGYVASLLRDAGGRLWVGQYGAGVAVLAATDADGRRRFRRLGAGDGLEPTVNALLADAAGAVWASTDAGLARIDPATLAVRAFGAPEGVHIPTYWTASAAATGAGELVFGGLTGLTVLRPDRVAPWRYRAPLVVSRVLVNDRALPVAPYNAGAGRRAAPVTVTPDGRARGFALEFAALDYSAPERNRYEYRLAGFDADWIKSEAGSRRAAYTNLPPGNYVLQLRGSNRNGDWGAPLEVPVRALPAWHQLPAARGAAALLALALLAALVQGRTALLRRRQRELQAMVAARTAELTAAQARLEAIAYADPLTGLPNRRRFNDELRHLAALAGRGGAGFTLLLIDLDHFKQVNDTLGHDAGDALLAAAAARLRAAVRESDRPFRLGGDEFAVLLAGTTDADTLAPVCGRILADLAAPLPHNGAVVRVSASVGGAVAADGDHEALYKRADVALYGAKAAGRATWRLAAGR